MPNTFYTYILNIYDLKLVDYIFNEPKLMFFYTQFNSSKHCCVKIIVIFLHPVQ